MGQNVLTIDLVVEHVEAVSRLALRLAIQLDLKFPYLTRCCQTHRQSPLLPSFTSTPEVRALPSRPEEFHLEALTDPDVNLSIHPGSCHHMKAAAFRPDLSVPPVAGCPIDPDVGDLLPSLGGHYPASPLLRSSPPLADASVLSASRFIRLRLFPYHRQPGSQVPCESPDEIHAAYTPDTAWPVGRFPPCFSQGRGTPRF